MLLHSLGGSIGFNETRTIQIGRNRDQGLPLQLSAPVNVFFEWVGKSRSSDDGSVRVMREKQEYNIVSNPCNEIGVRHLHNIRLKADRAFELGKRGESSTLDGSTPDTIDVQFNLAVTDTGAWFKRGIEVGLDRASEMVQSLTKS